MKWFYASPSSFVLYRRWRSCWNPPTLPFRSPAIIARDKLRVRTPSLRCSSAFWCSSTTGGWKSNRMLHFGKHNVSWSGEYVTLPLESQRHDVPGDPERAFQRGPKNFTSGCCKIHLCASRFEFETRNRCLWAVEAALLNFKCEKISFVLVSHSVGTSVCP